MTSFLKMSHTSSLWDPNPVDVEGLVRDTFPFHTVQFTGSSGSFPLSKAIKKAFLVVDFEVTAYLLNKISSSPSRHEHKPFSFTIL